MNKFKIIILFSVSLLMYNCTDLVNDNLDPDSVIEENVFSKVKNAEKVVLGAYSRMPLAGNIYAQALVTDELRVGKDNNGQGQQVNSWTYTSGTDDLNIWNGAYRSIQSANKLLLNFDDIIAVSTTDIALKNQLKGEALALRAFNHFLLVRAYSPKYDPNALGIPYVVTDDIFAQPSRPTMQSTYQSILDDCNAAYGLLTTQTSKARFNQTAVRALQAYVALEMNDFTGAITFADQALAMNNTLVSSLAGVSAMWTDTDTSELYFYQASLPGSIVAAPGALFTTTFLASGGLIYFNPSVNLYNSYTATDYRRPRYFSGTPVAPFNNFIVNKYPGTTGNYGVNNVKIFRTADMLMIRAEANARKAIPDLVAANMDYATLRTARNAGASPAFAGPTDAVDKILAERAREFAFEGKRLFDLKRNSRLIVRAAPDLNPSNPVTTLTDILKYTFPIPTSELQANPNIQPNPGY